MSFRDDPMAWVKEFSDSLLVPLVANHEIWMRSANVAFAAERKDKANIQQKLKESDYENSELTNDVDRLLAEKKKLTEEAEGLEITLESLILEHQKLKQSFDQKVTENKDLALRLQAMISKDDGYEKRGQEATRARYKEVMAKNDDLKVDVRKLQREGKKLNKNEETLKAKITASKSDLDIMEQNYLGALSNLETQLKDLKSQNETELRKNNATIKTLLQKIQQIALREFITSKERAFINSSLEQARIHINDNQLLLVIRDITALLRNMLNFPMRPTAPEFNNHLNSIMQNVGYAAPLQPATAPRPNKRRRVDPVPQNIMAPPRSLTGLIPVANDNTSESVDTPPVLNLEWAFEAHPQDRVPQ